MKINKSAKFWVGISLVICMISMIGASLVQTGSGSVTIKELNWESSAGHEVSALLYIPKTATKDHPAPGIVTVEGWYNNKEMQDLNAVEYARRGYVVVAVDMHSHGNSESLRQSELYDGAAGVDAAVQLIAALPYVDHNRIGVTGHSSGGCATNMAIAIDNQREVPIIKASFLVGSDWTDDNFDDYSGEYGNRSVGINASLYDEFFFYTYDEDWNILTVPRDFITTEGAQTFLNFNAEPSKGETFEAGTMYAKNINGVDAIRVIYTPKMIHPWNVFSKKVVSEGVAFFEKTLGAPHPLTGNNQVWQWKTVFNVFGLIGFFMFIVFFTLSLLDTGYFSSLKAEKEIIPLPAPSGTGKLWFWGGLVASAFFSGFCLLLVMKTTHGWPARSSIFFPQTAPFSLGVWALLCGIFSLIIIFLTYRFSLKSQGFSLIGRGLVISKEVLRKTIVLSVLVVSCAFGIVFFANYFFLTDFRVWVLAVKAFGPEKVLFALRYFPFFLVFYIANSIAINCFNYNEIGGKRKWLNITVLGVFNSLSGLVIIAVQYTAFFSTGLPFWSATEGGKMGPIWMFPLVVLLFIAALISRAIYKKTNNAYLAGIINALVTTMILCSNTVTILGTTFFRQ